MGHITTTANSGAGLRGRLRQLVLRLPSSDEGCGTNLCAPEDPRPSSGLPLAQADLVGVIIVMLPATDIFGHCQIPYDPVVSASHAGPTGRVHMVNARAKAPIWCGGRD
jgi:hypothetical protein